MEKKYGATPQAERDKALVKEGNQMIRIVRLEKALSWALKFYRENTAASKAEREHDKRMLEEALSLLADKKKKT